MMGSEIQNVVGICSLMKSTVTPRRDLVGEPGVGDAWGTKPH